MRERLDIPDMVPGMRMENWDVAEYAALIPHLDEETDKYTRGSVLAVAGSAAYPGAAMLAARAAARGGAGYVRIAAPEPIVTILQSLDMTIPVRSCPARHGAFAPEADEVILAGKPASALIFGPGVSVDPDIETLCARLLTGAEMPFVLDADGLTLLAASEGCHSACRGRKAPTVLTPHAGEMRRLLAGIDRKPLDVFPRTDAERAEAAFRVATCLQAVVVLKGHRTLIAAPDGTVVLSAYGTPALATAGTGDVLSGIIGALLAQGLPALQAAALGVYLHSRAGVMAARGRGRMSVVATDVIETIGAAIEALYEAVPERREDDTEEF